MSDPAATFAALLLAHAIADFVLQSDRMVRDKRRAGTALRHGLVVLATTAVLVNGPAAANYLVPAGLAAVHLLIDRVKLRFGDDLAPFLLDQAAHVATLALAAALWPGLWAGSVWAALPLPGALPVPLLLAHAAGLILVVRAGGFATGKVVAPFRTGWNTAGIVGTTRPGTGAPDAGTRIGELERLLIYILVVAGYPTGVAFLVAAKSVMRFNATSDDRGAAEYVVIGTLASVAWALAGTYAILWLTGALPAPPPAPRP